MSGADSEISVKFWGVRGSIPVSGPDTCRYGGNTSCVSIEGRHVLDGSEHIAILDAGTGIRPLGNLLACAPQKEILLLLTHTHWDHIQGFPFFTPIYQPERKIYLSRFERRKGLFRTLLEQMDGTRFPLTRDEIRSELDSYSCQWIKRQEKLGYQVSHLRVNHPGETYGYRIRVRGVTVVYIPDNELDPPYKPRASFNKMVKFCCGADLLIHDAQFLERDLPAKRGWGHSVVSRVRELALAAEVKHLVLFHHDPDRTDDELDAIQEESTCWFRERDAPITCTVAYDGLEIRLPCTSEPQLGEPMLPLPPAVASSLIP
jgi:phosphoribosyl 1,2-cyclic phosphodiesterase